MTTASPGPIVVGVADADPRSDALDWAAAEAAARGVPLRVVHVRPTLVVADAWGMFTVYDDEASFRSAEGVVRASLLRARAVAPDGVVGGRVLRGSPADVLAAQTRHAALLVLGGPDPQAAGRRSGGALPARVSARATCPVAVVRRRPRTPAGASRARIVVGVDAGGAAGPAVRFAFQAARQRGVPLIAVHVRPHDVPGETDGVPVEEPAVVAGARLVLDEALDHWRSRFPTVAVNRRILGGDPVGALVAASADSSLLVLGCRRRGSIRRALFGSVGGAVARFAACPVAVVGTDRVAPAIRRPRLVDESTTW